MFLDHTTCLPRSPEFISFAVHQAYGASLVEQILEVRPHLLVVVGAAMACLLSHVFQRSPGFKARRREGDMTYRLSHTRARQSYGIPEVERCGKTGREVVAQPVFLSSAVREGPQKSRLSKALTINESIASGCQNRYPPCVVRSFLAASRLVQVSGFV